MARGGAGPLCESRAFAARMLGVESLLPDLDLRDVVYHLGKMFISFLLALPMAWDQEKATRGLGLRTFPLVALASTGFILIARTSFGDSSPDAQARVLEGLITGVGFLGGGAILKHGREVHGTATAASIWNTAALGAAVAYGRYEIAILLSAINFLVLRYFRVIKERLGWVEPADEEGDGPPPESRVQSEENEGDRSG